MVMVQILSHITREATGDFKSMLHPSLIKLVDQDWNIMPGKCASKVYHFLCIYVYTSLTTFNTQKMEHIYLDGAVNTHLNSPIIPASLVQER